MNNQQQEESKKPKIITNNEGKTIAIINGEINVDILAQFFFNHYYLHK